MEDRLPKLTKDGVTIVKNIYLPDPVQELACSVLRQAAHNTNVYCGDGTTTSTIIACSIFKEGQKLVAAGQNPIRLKKGIEMARDVVIEFLEEIKSEVKSLELLKKCAMVIMAADTGIN